MLDGCRQYGFGGPQPITLEAIVRWMDEIGIVHRFDREAFIETVMFLDGEFLMLCANDRKAKEKHHK